MARYAGCAVVIWLVVGCDNTVEVDLDAAEKEVAEYLEAKYGQPPKAVECEDPAASGNESAMKCAVTAPAGGYMETDMVGNEIGVKANTKVYVVGKVDDGNITWQWGMLS